MSAFQNKSPIKQLPWLFPLLLLLILAVAGGVRTLNLNWDQGTHLHPDERYLTMVVSALELPDHGSQYWDTATSPLNPTNRNYAHYVYGTLPLFATRVVGGWLDHACGDTPAPVAQAARLVLLGATTPCWTGTYSGYNGAHLVGRILSTLADLAALLALALLARRLYGERAALLAAVLYAFAVLPIQHAHFFVVDSFASVFVVWTLFLAVRSVQTGQHWSLTLAGLTAGLAVACKISTWPLVGMVALAAVLIPTKTETGEHRIAFQVSWTGLLALIVAGLLAFVAFRTAQPYAFTGPAFWNIRIDPAWWADMRYIRNLVSGSVDVPYGHQWTNRVPIVFPWVNMVFWGLGLPLGLTAWAGWAAMGWQTFRRQQWQHLIPWLWGTLFFLYQATQWVKSMRYLLPVYAVFVLFAAWVLERGIAWATGQHQVAGKWTRFIRPLQGTLRGLPWVVLGGTVLWAVAFLQIYLRPFSRVEASRWIFNAVPTAATLTLDDGASIQVPIQPGITIDKATPLAVSFAIEMDGHITGLTLNKVLSLGTGGTRRLQATLARDPGGSSPLVQNEITASLPAEGLQSITVPLPATTVKTGEVLFLILRVQDGDPVTLQTSVIGAEQWDDPLPISIDGKAPFYNWYRGLTSTADGLMAVYDEDTEDKRTRLLSWLDEIDYIIITSNRAYASIPRLSMRYPLTIAYYQALFDGSLGFELIGDFASFPALGPCQFPDQEAPFTIPQARYSTARPCSIPYPAAEEAFSVYDHPRVLVFAKTAAYSRAQAEAVLPVSLLADVHWMTPLQASRRSTTPSLLLSTEMRADQEAGGTWSQLFRRDALQNRSQIVAVLLWWGMLTLLGWLAFPWLYLALPALRDRGYALARAAGLLMWAYPAWLLSALKLVPHTRLLLWAVFLAWALATAALVRPRRVELATFIRTHWRELAWVEGLAVLLYGAWVLVRYLNPDLWHPVVGGEKPMDFAYLNAVIKSTWFPPYDPWFAGGQMNYYYFGFVMIGSLIKALGIIPSIAYNLAVPSLFALTGIGAYTLASNLAGGSAARGRRAGICGLLLTLLLGNLGEMRLIFNGLAEVGGISFPSLIPGYPEAISALAGFWKVLVEGVPLVFRPEWWYWNATRMVPLKDIYDPGVINEFPLFTFLYSDLHAHMMAFPLTQVALGIALQWGMAGIGRPAGETADNGAAAPRFLRRVADWLPRPWITLLLASLVAGALRATNTWDYPTYLGLMGLAPLLALLNDKQPASSSGQDDEEENGRPRGSLYRALLVPVLVFILAELLFRPYTTHYAIAYTRFGPWAGLKTPLGIYLLMHGQFIFPLVLLAGAAMWRLFRRFRGVPGRDMLIGLAIVISGLLALLGVLLTLEVHIAWIAVPLGVAAALLVLDEGTSPQRRLLWLWVGTALTLSLVVEVIVLEGDVGRMNTVFKFYLQVWMLLALAAAVALERILSYIPPAVRETAPALERWYQRYAYNLADLTLGMLSVILFSAALYPLFAIPARVRDRWNQAAPHTLDGMAYLLYATQYEHEGTVPLAADYRVIQWLQDNVAGSPTIIEAQAEREYLWGNRISIYTGLPAVAGWRWHQVQQRMVMPGGTVELRQSDITEFYNTTDPAQALAILRRYDVRYVILTPYERAYMNPEGATKFPTMVANGWLEVAYQDADSAIYRVK